ncbi:MAG: hypothetical protein EHM61_22755 [Acidobacteria bacterium]|nr:MAG: hypothetical protein EHM61_22755 [Acidobacteriota bacterium]
MRIRNASLVRLFYFGLLTTSFVFIFSSGSQLLAESQRSERASERAEFVMLRSYFPLQTGYRWVYSVERAGGGLGWEVKVEAEESVSFLRSYHRLSGYFGPNDSRRVRATLLGNVVERGKDGKEYLWYQFNAPVGKSWEMDIAPDNAPACEDGATLTIGARDEVVSVPAGEFRHVIRVDHIPRCVDAGITREWFAPGVGLVRRESTSIAGAVVSELVYAELGDIILPKSVYSTSLLLSSPTYGHNLMPPIDPSKVARVQGTFVVRNQTEGPAELLFPSACVTLQLEVRDAEGKLVLQKLPEIVCPAIVLKVDLAKQPLVVPFSLVLADKDGKPLPDGSYSLTVVLLTSVPHETLRPAARAPIQISSAH